MAVGIRRVRELLTRFCRKGAGRRRRRLLGRTFEARRIPRRLRGSGGLFLDFFPKRIISGIPTKLRSGLDQVVSRGTRRRRHFFRQGGTGHG